MATRRPARSARSCSHAWTRSIALTEPARAAAEQRFPGDYRLLSPGVDTTLFAPAAKTNTIVVELRPNERVIARGVMEELHDLPGWEVVLLRTRPLIARPTIPRILARRVHLRTARDGAARAALLNGAAIFVPGLDGLARIRLEASAAGCALAEPPGRADQPELAAAAAARLAEHEEVRAARARRPAPKPSLRASQRSRRSWPSSTRGWRARRRPPRRAEPLADRPWIVADLHMHTSWSHDCAVDAGELVDHAIAEGLGAIAVTDHNVFGGALEAVDYAEGRDLIVIPGEEVKTDGQGEVIGLFLQREIPRGMSFGDTVAAIREQDGLVYVPHPFDRLHAIPDPADAPPARRRHRRASRSTTPVCSSRATTTRRCGSRGSTT